MENIFQIKKRVLVVGGDPRTLAEVKKSLREVFEIILASASAAAVRAMNGRDIDAAVVCPGSGGDLSAADVAEVCGLAAAKGIPVLFLTERDDGQAERDAFVLYNAADYLVRRKESDAFVSRLSLRIRAGDNERRVHEKSRRVPAEKMILVAEDVALNREIVGAMLSDTEGLTAVFADDGLDAVEKFGKNAEACQLILMDIYMPEMDGLSAAKAIRRLNCPAARNVPIIALTASAGEDDIAGFREAGMNGYLEKPIDGDKLTEVIRLYV